MVSLTRKLALRRARMRSRLRLRSDVLHVERLVAVTQVAGERQRATLLRDDVGGLVGGGLGLVDGLLGLRLRLLERIDLGGRAPRAAPSAPRFRRSARTPARARDRGADDGAGDGQGKEFACHVCSLVTWNDICLTRTANGEAGARRRRSASELQRLQRLGVVADLADLVLERRDQALVGQITFLAQRLLAGVLGDEFGNAAGSRSRAPSSRR